MSNQSNVQGWLCGTCRKMKSPSAWFCDLCGQSWEESAVPTAQQRSNSQSRHAYMDPQTESEQTPWEGQAWPKSPRQTSQLGWNAPKQQRRQQQPHKGGKKGHKGPKGKAGEGRDRQAARVKESPSSWHHRPPPPPPISGLNAVAAPWMNMPTPPGAPTTSTPSAGNND